MNRNSITKYSLSILFVVIGLPLGMQVAHSQTSEIPNFTHPKWDTTPAPVASPNLNFLGHSPLPPGNLGSEIPNFLSPQWNITPIAIPSASPTPPSFQCMPVANKPKVVISDWAKCPMCLSSKQTTDEKSAICEACCIKLAPNSHEYTYCKAACLY